ncbi:hypothetical protein BS50DRAFT_623296 [Corynespora cassiicola Philippines]|uniref:DUF262 domain-containing protein n=1 Tax=Corynespora cassiicola Philippines TaxID=1448308 RepID=A0A2T2NDN9_CORCC|nr:hypothetical protein BS50DRAFT_623296 [Corynespora cassiicola Philippines]
MPGLPGRIMISASSRLGTTGFDSLQPQMEVEDDEGGECSEESSEDDNGHYEPRPQLSEPQVSELSLEKVIKRLDEKSIEIEPEYQRGIIWKPDRMTGLINSLMGVCVDGKQRLSSVKAFVIGEIPCHDHRGEKWWFTNTFNTRRQRILPPEMQKEFLAKKFICYEFKDLSPAQEEDLFARVQMGVSLSVAERLWATSGPWQELAKLFLADFPSIFALSKDQQKTKVFQEALSCFSQIVEVQYPTSTNGIPVHKSGTNTLNRFVENKSAADDGIKSHLSSVFSTFDELVEEHPDTFSNTDNWLKHVATFAPIEMVAVSVLISMHADTRDNTALIGDIRALRIELRKRFTELKKNKTTWTFVWDWISNLGAIRNHGDTTTIRQRNWSHKSIKGSGVANAAQGAPSTVLTSLKRVRSPAKNKSSNIMPTNRAPIGPSPTQNGSQGSQEVLTDMNPSKIARVEPPISRPPPLFLRSSQNTVTVSDKTTPPDMSEAHLISSAASDPSRVSVMSSDSLIQYGNFASNCTYVDPSMKMSSNLAQNPSLTPIQARQNRIAELNSYRAPSASMAPNQAYNNMSSLPQVTDAIGYTIHHVPTAPMATTPVSGYPSPTFSVWSQPNANSYSYVGSHSVNTDSRAENRIAIAGAAPMPRSSIDKSTSPRRLRTRNKLEQMSAPGRTRTTFSKYHTREMSTSKMDSKAEVIDLTDDTDQ